MFKNLSILNIKIDYSNLDVDKHKTKRKVHLELKEYKNNIKNTKNTLSISFYSLFAEFCILEKSVFLQEITPSNPSKS